jgi:hypothetical protein
LEGRRQPTAQRLTPHHEVAGEPGRGSYRQSLTGQLDLFAHSRTVILINDLIDSFLERNAARVSERLRLLRAETPGHPLLDPMGTLREALERWPAVTTDAREAAQVVEWFDSEVTAAAATCLGASASTFMRSLWRDLAGSVSAHAYNPAYPQAHCTYCYLRAGDAPAALQAVAAIRGRDLDPIVLQWVTLARHRMLGSHAWRVPLFTLALTTPQRLPATLSALADPSLQGDWERFWLDCAWLDPRETTAGSWFPAWYLIEHPATRIDEPVAVGDPDAPPVRAFETMRLLLTLEPSGYDAALISARPELRRIDASLFRRYMSRRESREEERL